MLVVASMAVIARCSFVNDLAAGDERRLASAVRSVLRDVKPGMTADEAARRMRAMGLEPSERVFAADEPDTWGDDLPLEEGEAPPPSALVDLVRRRHRGFLEIVVSEPQIWVFLNADRVVTDVRFRWVHTGP